MLTRQSAEWERRTHHQLVIVTTPSLDGKPVRDYAIDLANQWGIGRRGYNDGMMVLVAPGERKARLSVGRGLERRFSDRWCDALVQRGMVPRFRTGHWFDGIEAAVLAITS